jgi:hypothetical protein
LSGGSYFATTGTIPFLDISPFSSVATTQVSVAVSLPRLKLLLLKLLLSFNFSLASVAGFNFCEKVSANTVEVF